MGQTSGKVLNRKKDEQSGFTYTQLTANVSKTFKMEENAMHPSEVARTVLDVVTSDDSQLRYVVGTTRLKRSKRGKICLT